VTSFEQVEDKVLLDVLGVVIAESVSPSQLPALDACKTQNIGVDLISAS
jgi:hypothetical protein